MPSERLAVLCIDDDRVTSAIVEIALSLDPHIDAHFASSGEEALELIDGGLCAELILLDANLPGASGVDIARVLTGDDRATAPKIIFLTASTRAAELDSFREAGAAGVIGKPFDPLSLCGQIRAFLKN